MSKSYKKTPIIKDNTGTKQLQWYKRHANKTVRRTADIANGKAYKKVYCTWNIHDYSFRQTYNEYLKERVSKLKHYLNIYGSIDEIPERLKRDFYDIDCNFWLKTYYRK